MLSELRVSQLGVIEDLALVLGPGMTALTGETGAGKTLVVEAVELLVGGRAEGVLVRSGAEEAVVEGRFVSSGQEVVLARVVPPEGRSRAYVDGRMASVSQLAEVGANLVDLHGQHAHQSLFSPRAQREALDSFAGASPQAREAARSRLRDLTAALASVGGDALARDRELQLLTFQLGEIEAACLTGAEEDEGLAEEEDALSRAASYRARAAAVYQALAGEDQVIDRVGVAVAQLSGHGPLAALHDRLRGLAAELTDAAGDARAAAEALEEDPERLAQVVARRALLRELRRKYGGLSSSLEEVLAFQAGAKERLRALGDLEGRAAGLEEERLQAVAELEETSRALGRARRAAAGEMGRAVEAELRRLAMPKARFRVLVRGAAGGDGTDDTRWRDLAGDDVSFLFAANPAEPLLALSKIASGGELARVMLALRLVLVKRSPRARADDAGPTTLVFDEVDAGIGGQAALAVGRALAELSRRYQVVVVTHLAQVAAFASAQVAVVKADRRGRTTTVARPVTGPDRVAELSRMMSGRPDSQAAQLHAAELLRRAQDGG